MRLNAADAVRLNAADAVRLKLNGANAAADVTAADRATVADVAEAERRLR
ncbi:hypothetical protein J4573_50015 [Actinomadura barringtoniae]|uniref:Uncharacterized protein n=1 Tax=Actinomadura barringtoniae TaxID=1427535 RepID=A0A939PV07_9ACTN|nr:hypothetical protein [Actinomadura barringtoniae]MBO2455296.1 hypothetical protein [Actinomadura barringtoniae]